MLCHTGIEEKSRCASSHRGQCSKPPDSTHCFRSLTCERVCVHRNLCLAIASAQVTFLAGVDAVGERVSLGGCCSVSSVTNV